MAAAAVFLARDGRFVATELARGPWDPEAQHGGAPAALLMRALEQVEGFEHLSLARVTYEFLRPAPLGELVVSVGVVRAGRRVALLEGSLSDVDGVELVRARALRVAGADAAENSPSAARDVPGPADGRRDDYFSSSGVVMFGSDAMELRFVEGEFGAPGRATAWFRMVCPLVAGEEPSPLQRVAAAADFGNGISSILPWDDHLFINPDLTVYLERQPAGEWICLQSETRIAAGGIGVAESVLYDEQGRVGRATQALLVSRR